MVSSPHNFDYENNSEFAVLAALEMPISHIEEHTAAAAVTHASAE